MTDITESSGIPDEDLITDPDDEKDYTQYVGEPLVEEQPTEPEPEVG